MAGTTDSYIRTLEDGETLFEQGDFPTHLYLIQSGDVVLQRRAGDALEDVGIFGRGCVLGERDLLFALEHAVSARAVGRVSVLVIAREELAGHSDDPAVQEILAGMASRFEAEDGPSDADPSLLRAWRRRSAVAAEAARGRF